MNQLQVSKNMEILIDNLSKNVGIGPDISKILNQKAVDVDGLLSLLSAFLQKHIIDNQFNWTAKDLKTALDIVESIRRLNETKLKKDTSKINTAIFQLLIREFVRIIHANLDKNKASMIMNQLKNIEFPEGIEEIDFEIL